MKVTKRICKEAGKVTVNVFKKCFSAKDKEFDYADAVLIGLLENMIDHTKSIILLLESKNYASLDIILRSIFENYVFMEYILEKDTELRSKAYVVSDKIKEVKLFDKITEDTLEGRRIRELLGVTKEKVLAEGGAINENYRDDLERRYLNELGMKRLEQKWFNLDGNKKDLRKVCTALGLDAEYNLLYSILSNETHGKDAVKNFNIVKGRVDLLEKIKDEKLHLSMSGLLIMNAVKGLYTYYGLKSDLKKFHTMIGINSRYK